MDVYHMFSRQTRGYSRRAPHLQWFFNIALKKSVMKKMMNKGAGIKLKTYAYDIAFIVRTEKDLQTIAHTFIKDNVEIANKIKPSA